MNRYRSGNPPIAGDLLTQPGCPLLHCEILEHVVDHGFPLALSEPNTSGID